MKLRAALQGRLEESLPMQTQLGVNLEKREMLESGFLI